MLPSEITGPGPHANDGAHNAWSNRPHRDWVEATNAGQTHRPTKPGRCTYVFPRFERRQCVLSSGHDSPHQTRRWP